MSENKKVFGAIPFRAVGDERLSRADLQVLIAMAAHDRLGQSELGCVASRDRIAFQTDLSPSTVSTSCRDLIKHGYITRKQHPKDRRKNSYRVIYNDDDRRSFKEKTDKNRVRSKGKPRREICRGPTTQLGSEQTTQIPPASTINPSEIGRGESAPTPTSKPNFARNINNGTKTKNQRLPKQERLRASASVRGLGQEVSEIGYARLQGDLNDREAIHQLEHLRSLADAYGDVSAYERANQLLGEIIGVEIPF